MFRMDVEKLKHDLKNHEQGQVLKFWDKLDENNKEKLYKDVRSIDLAKTNRSFQESFEEAETHKGEKKDERIKPVPEEQVGSVATAGPNLNIWNERGLQEISESRVAVLLMAGGQGTRLGVDYPKGMYSVGLPSNKTLYNLQAERILKVQDLAHKKFGKQCYVPWYIMTSGATMGKTKDYFEQHNHFGLQPENVVMFEQSAIPCMDFEGKIILRSPFEVARAPDGNGGLYNALGRHKILEDMKQRGIKYVHVYGVDNILVKVADPVFTGFCIAKNAECGAKVVEKQHPNESVGVVCLCDGNYQVVEYSEISSQTAEKRNPDGNLMFRDGNICNHFFTFDFLERIVREHESELKYHVAKKKIPFADDSGNVVKPDKPNGIKLEKFVFDVFKFAEKFAVLEVLREDEFAALKNAPKSKSDCPETSRDAVLNLHKRYIVSAGGKFTDTDGSVISDIEKFPVVCELSPLVSYAGEGLEEHVKDRCFPASEVLHLQSKEELSENGPASPEAKKAKRE